MTGHRPRLGSGTLATGQATATAFVIAIPFLAGTRPAWWQWLVDGALVALLGRTLRQVSRHRCAADQQLEIRPRYGQLHRAHGGVVSLVFHPDPDKPGAFVGVAAGTEKPVELRPGDTMTVDALGAGQTARIGTAPR